MRVRPQKKSVALRRHTQDPRENRSVDGWNGGRRRPAEVDMGPLWALRPRSVVSPGRRSRLRSWSRRCDFARAAGEAPRLCGRAAPRLRDPSRRPATARPCSETGTPRRARRVLRPVSARPIWSEPGLGSKRAGGRAGGPLTWKSAGLRRRRRARALRARGRGCQFRGALVNKAGAEAWAQSLQGRRLQIPWSATRSAAPIFLLAKTTRVLTSPCG